MQYTIKMRRDYSSRWASLNHVLAQGEPAFEIDTGKMKIGDGNTHWLDLPYFSPDNSDASAQLLEHVNSLLPHPVYDDGPSLALLYENAKV